MVEHRGRPQTSEVLRRIQDAIAENRVLCIDYYSYHRDTTSSRHVEPAGLLYYSDRWHLIAYCRKRKDYRDFRTDRISKLELLQEKFRPNPGFSLRKYIKESYTMERPVEIRLLFEPQAARIVREKYSNGLAEERETADGVLMTFMIPETSWITQWLLSFGTTVKVLAPDTLRDAVVEQAKQVLDQYNHTR